MKKIFLFTAVLVSIALSGCSDQDPYADASADVKAGRPKEGPKPPDEKPLGKDVLIVDGEGFEEHILFKQDEEREVTITARSFFDDSKYRLEITNLDSFKDITVVESIEGDKAAGIVASVKFKWKPTVKDIIDDITVRKLETQVYTTNLNNVYKHNQTLTVFIYRGNYAVPQIISVDTLSSPVKEGDISQKFFVKVRDLDSFDIDGARPRLMALPDYQFVNGAPYLEIGKPFQDKMDKTIWTFPVTVDLSTAELTVDEDVARFYVSAVSRFDKWSLPTGGDFTVWTSVSTPVTTWQDILQFKVGTLNYYQFTVYDAKDEGSVTASFTTMCSKLVGTPECTCKEKANEASCTIKWAVPVDAKVGSFSYLNYSAKNKSPNKSDTDVESNTFTGIIEIVN